MRKKNPCKKCPYGPYDPCSDWCDECTMDADTGWGGFMDHRVGKHFDSEEEQRQYYQKHNIE